MQVKLITTIETIIEVGREIGEDFNIEEVKREIFGKYAEAVDQDAEQGQFIEGVKNLQASAVHHDILMGTVTSHSFEEVK